MKILIISVGKERDDLTENIVHHYYLRIMRYLPVEFLYIPHESTKEKEGEKILSYLKKDDYVVLLDEKGKELKSEAVADMIANRMVDSVRRMVFIIGGSYGVSKSIEERSQYTWKLSSLVFPHLLVRVILLEQLYRAFTIIKGEKYHHD